MLYHVAFYPSLSLVSAIPGLHCVHCAHWLSFSIARNWLFFSVPRNLTNTSFLTIGYSSSYYHDYSNVSSHSTNIPKQRGLEGFRQYNAGNRFGRMWIKGWTNPQSLSCWRDFQFARGEKEVKQRPWRKLVISDRTQ